MVYNRVQLKNTAKRRIRQGAVPNILSVTLIYLLLTSLLDDLVSIITTYQDYDLLYDMDEALTDALLTGDFDYANSLTASYYTGNNGLFSLFCTIFMFLFCAMLAAGLCKYFLNIARDRLDAGYADLSYGLEILPKIILLTIIKTVMIFLWSMLFIIPGLIAHYRYSMATYILIDNPEISPLEAIRRSKAMMRGHKFDLFVLGISFYGWIFVAIALSTVADSLGYQLACYLLSDGLICEIIALLFSFGGYLIVGLWLTAYIHLSQVYFYEYIRGAYGSVPPNDRYIYDANNNSGNDNHSDNNYTSSHDSHNRDPWD